MRIIGLVFLMIFSCLYVSGSQTDAEVVSAGLQVFVGASLGSSDRESLEKQSPYTLNKIDQGQQLTVIDIKSMVNAGLSDSIIINQIETTHSVFYLSTADILDLKQAHVSQRIIDYMIKTGNS